MKKVNNLIILLMTNIFYTIENCHGINEPNKILNQTSNLMKGIKDNFSNKFKRQQTWYLPDFEESPLAYPGKDAIKIKKNKEEWDIYYKCLDEQILLYEPNKMIPVIAKMLFEGTTLKIQCGLCQSPDEINISPNWFFSETYNRSKAQQIIDDTQFITISPYDGTLNIFNLQGYDAGLYYCSFKEMTGPEYYVHVTDDTEPIITVWPPSAKQHQHPQKEIVLPHLGIAIRSEWSDWTGCNRCGYAGKRMRYGSCMIYANTDYNEVKRPELSIFQQFREGIPCRSKLLPAKIFKDPDVEERPSEIMIGYCKVPCKETEIFIEYDENGAQTIVNNTNGVYSIMQQLPPADPLPVILPVYAQYAQKTVLICPGNLNRDNPVLWTIGHHLIYGPTIKNKTRGRIIIDDLNRIVIKKAEFSDTKLYSCWQEKKLAGQIHLIVTEMSGERKFDKLITVVGVTMILGVFLYIYYRVYARSRTIKKGVKMKKSPKFFRPSI